MNTLTHVWLTACHAFANWRTQRHLNLADAWNETAKAVAKRMRARS